MPHRPADSYLQPYREAVHAHGAGFPATLWLSREAQQLRFDVLIDMVGIDELKDCIILDAGCAVGDLAARLKDRNVQFKRYIGIDALPQPIQTARQTSCDRCQFHIADLIHEPAAFRQFEADYILISGTLNTMDEELAQQLVKAAFEAARGGVAFNFLSDRAPEHCLTRDIGPSKRFNTIEWLNWALTRTALISFSQEYLDGHDATIVMRK